MSEGIHPADIHQEVGQYSHGLKVSLSEVKDLVVVAGQLPIDKDGNDVGVDDFAAQVDMVLENVEATLIAAGSSPAEIIQLRTYMLDPGDLAVFGERRGKFYERTLPADGVAPPNTTLFVSHLVRPQSRIEIEAIATAS